MGFIMAGIFICKNNSEGFNIIEKLIKLRNINYLNKEIGLTLPESRRNIADFAQHARALTIRLHTPQCLISEKMVRLI